MSVAERTREAIRAEPFLLAALAAGVVNYRAAARWLDVDGDEESIATALRRFANDLEEPSPVDRRISVRLRRGDVDDALDSAVTAGEASDGLAAIEVSGEIDADALERVLARLRAEDVAVEAAAVAGDSLTVAVPARAGADGLRLVEAALGAP